MSRDSTCDFVLSITTSNVVWWNKNVKTTLQEESDKESAPFLALPLLFDNRIDFRLKGRIVK